MAEEVGFEPTEGVNLRRFSRPVHSTTLPLLRQGPCKRIELILKAGRLTTNFGGYGSRAFHRDVNALLYCIKRQTETGYGGNPVLLNAYVLEEKLGRL